MDGRRFSMLICGGVLAAAVGCQSTPKTPAQQVSEHMPVASKPSMWDRMTGRSTYGPPPSVNPANDFASTPKGKPGQPLKPETECEFAETALASALDPNCPFGEKDRKIDDARQRFQKVLQRDPKFGRAMLGLARLYAETGDRDHSSEWLKKYFELSPRDHKAAYDLAMVFGRRKDYPAAISGCQFALSIDPENREYCKALAFFQAFNGQVEDAVTTLTAKRAMTEAQARHNIAGILDQMQQTEACKQQLRLAMQADPGFAPARQFYAELETASTIDPNIVRTEYRTGQ